MFFRQELGRKSALPDAPMTACFYCGFDLRYSSGQPAPSALVQQQTEWYRILSEGWHEQVFYPHLYFDVLRQVAKTLFSPSLFGSDWQREISQQAGAYLPSEAWQVRPEHIALEFWPFIVRKALLQQAQWLLEDWPRRFLAMMKQYRIASTPLLRDRKVFPYWYESVVRDHLYVNNVNRRFKEFWN
ncbi:hypothetical protein [Hymenobacter sp. GOD-10R]|uniref:hypothetical protein n=1 Tax=Hymenobacter sp. GOD-10R TaxID=3093922 RepID=UPI002D78A054|nr:hypothetical protein [Hymenobacter sp. GOD-10R]WRQ28143.1 hypothetical protein SD425_24055 [Hymenobacter sp. GOD-10R]